ncbi:MAG: pantoate--beta-alanine ligase [Gemmatimonadales bacterium]|nr:pantoate--beta-alanine ligase [Gemmatimonadales bacterium]NIN12478.1 pantoate--beta-alanine ligase [Gemmatimonadales bacterium]NIN50854.1 pantoate--beta-alanine ligase [Gemmatimonadales bacterium]NIP08318.1 pantoate--beta-alanine ligase [Gemmatimonadales bacterium]NIR00842.1 pantoate--beta-alanine ligase [Gemmatimonadales bacterium]
MIEISDPQQMRAWSRAVRSSGQTVGFVATMGYLHEGHLHLIDRARERTDQVVASIFVNPIQFGPQDDLLRYPRDLEHDRAAALQRGADCLFVPDESVMYPSPPLVRVAPGSLADHLCGPRRPGHFEGVLTVVIKLLHIVEPDVAVFGRKDAQQAVIIGRMVADLNVPTEIDVAPTLREADGLAMSSRNVYLTEEERRAAPALARGLDAAHRAFQSGTRDPEALIAAVRQCLAAEPEIDTEYVELVDQRSLQPVTSVTADALLAAAVHLGSARLIDNIILGEGTAADIRLKG